MYFGHCIGNDIPKSREEGEIAEHQGEAVQNGFIVVYKGDSCHQKGREKAAGCVTAQQREREELHGREKEAGEKSGAFVGENPLPRSGKTLQCDRLGKPEKYKWHYHGAQKMQRSLPRAADGTRVLFQIALEEEIKILDFA